MVRVYAISFIDILGREHEHRFVYSRRMPEERIVKAAQKFFKRGSWQMDMTKTVSVREVTN